MDQMPREELLHFALELAEAAAERIEPRYRRCEASLKADGSEVTDADREAELAMRALIAERHPDHAVMGEEFASSASREADHLWVLDPIDGTASFTLGVPLFGTLVGLLERGEPTVGVIHIPALHETLYATAGGGCWHRQGDSPPTRVHVVSAPTLAESAVSATALHSSDLTCEPGQKPYRLSAYARGARKFRFVTDCFQHLLVCRGSLQAALDTLMKPWDVAALVPCIREAGGKATTADGDEAGVIWGGSLLSSCGEPLHSELVEVLRPAAGTQP
jgi:histidinol-phosphatase